MTLKLVLLSVLLVWNLLVLCAYGLDKSKAIRHKRRISEKALLLQTLIFGGIGAFLVENFLDIKLTNGILSYVGLWELLLMSLFYTLF
jgi:predicted membrane protein